MGPEAKTREMLSHYPIPRIEDTYENALKIVAIRSPSTYILIR